MHTMRPARGQDHEFITLDNDQRDHYTPVNITVQGNKSLDLNLQPNW